MSTSGNSLPRGENNPFVPPVSNSPHFADNPFADPQIAMRWIRVFRRLFISRDDTYGLRALNYNYLEREPASITDEVLYDHLRGNHIVHVYPLHVIDFGVKVCVLDVDCHEIDLNGEVDRRPEINFTCFETIWRRLRSLELPVLLEDSDGRGGLHLWLFVDNLSNQQAISITAWMASLADSNGQNVERYPSGDIDGTRGFGRCIRLPGRHQTRYHFSRFWDGIQWIDGVAAIEMLQLMTPASRSQLPPESLTFRPPTVSRNLNSTPATRNEAYQDYHIPPIEIISAALNCLGEDFYDNTRDEWILVGIGLLSCVRTDAERDLYFDLWRTWSLQAGDRWNEQDAMRDWDSFAADGPFQWRDFIRLAMEEGYVPPVAWNPIYSQHVHPNAASAVAYQPAPPAGELVSIETLRNAVVDIRMRSLVQSGIFLDSSGTGSGKSTADLLIAESGHRVLVVVPDHLNAREIAAEAEMREIQAICFPKRVYGDLNPDPAIERPANVNCWNADADRAEASGLAVQHSVCRECIHRRLCKSNGYLGLLHQARPRSTNTPAVITMTHRRAQLLGLARICQQYHIDYVAIHENLTDFLASRYGITMENIHELQRLLQTLRTRPELANRVGVADVQITENSSQIAHSFFQTQQTREATLPEREQRLRNDVRNWFQYASGVAEQLEAGLSAVSDARSIDIPPFTLEVDPRLIRRLHSLFWHATQFINNASNATALSTSGQRSAAATSNMPTSNPVLRLLMEMTTSGVRRIVGLPAMVGLRAARARLVVVSNVSLPAEISIWLCDATASLDALQAIVPEIQDRTPELRVASHHTVLQVPDFDIKRGQLNGRNSTVMRALRRVLELYPEKNRICIFTHRPHIDAIRALQNSKITEVHYLHSAVARGSNSLHQQNDLLIILGTPRAGGPASVVDRLVQIGDIDAINSSGEWGSILYSITDGESQTRNIASSQYRHPAWNAAYNTIVEPELLQIVGRARPVLPEGCDVVVVSSHLIGVPFTEFREVSLTHSQEQIWQVCKTLPIPFARRDIVRALAGTAAGRTVGAAIARLLELCYIELHGTARGRSTCYELSTTSRYVRDTGIDEECGEDDSEEDDVDDDFDQDDLNF